MRAAFRVDASRAIGTGHVMRCLALADAIRADGGECTFVMRRLDGHLIDFVAGRGHHVEPLPAPDAARRAAATDSHLAWLEADPATDATQSAAAIAAAGGADWLVVDHYALDATWEHAVRAAVDRVAVIDDLADRPHDADLLIDQNLSDDAGRYDGLTAAGCTRLLGPRYALLRPEFAARRAAGTRDPRAPVRRVLVFLGGVDAPGATLPALAALESVRDGELAADVVIGATNPRADAIADWCRTRAWVRLHPGSADLAALMDGCDLAIGAGGTTVWERCALALPSVIVTIASNQLAGASAVARRGAALYAGPATPPEACETNLAVMLSALIGSEDLRSHVAESAAALVDGRGVARVLARLQESLPALRRAEPA
ncbi:MAG: UDP-2,4-diacetamido-2,4,6-trideoxy-beta-L-altropyranose hydrolase, partial [Sphingomonadaceae bacterium]|nr:UDP-2,4-diacetamido-2,4,6-trideoxy-beta-L-altropyranose hydrolase [Sphingomonadaceae bacterium]